MVASAKRLSGMCGFWSQVARRPDRSVKPPMATMSGRRKLAAIVVSGRPPPCTARVNFAMKSAFGTSSLLRVMAGYLALKALLTRSSPAISLSLVKVCQ